MTDKLPEGLLKILEEIPECEHEFWNEKIKRFGSCQKCGLLEKPPEQEPTVCENRTVDKVQEAKEELESFLDKGVLAFNDKQIYCDLMNQAWKLIIALDFQDMSNRETEINMKEECVDTGDISIANINVGEWQSIETAPRAKEMVEYDYKAKPYLVYRESDGEDDISITNDTEYPWHSMNGYTHWMPLPKPPTNNK